MTTKKADYSTDNRVFVFLDIETDVPVDKAFADVGQLAVSDIKCWVASVQRGTDVSTTVCGNTSFTPPTAEFMAAFPDFVRTENREGKEVVVVGHNILRFDAPVLKRLAGVDIHSLCTVMDTLILSKILHPESTSHSLDYWYANFGMTKKPLSYDVHDLLLRCEEDVEVTRKLFWFLWDRAKSQGIPESVFKLEYEVARIIAEQHKLGVTFDKHEANHLAGSLEFRSSAIRINVLRSGAGIVNKKPDTPPAKQFNKDGSVSQNAHKWAARHGWTIVEKSPGQAFLDQGATQTALPVDASVVPLRKPLNLDSITEVKEYLLEKGWKPTIWNRKVKGGKFINTSPKIFDDSKAMCPNLAGMLGDPVVDNIKEYLTLKSRLGVLNGWLENTRVKAEGIICPDADTVGAVTGRFTHKIVANVPRVTSPYGREMRILFTSRKGRNMVGWDASSLEARMEAHYTYKYDGGKYAKELLEGDIHAKNAGNLGLTRDQAKTFKYAVTYGASATKLASTFGWSSKHAQLVLEEFWKSNPALSQLTEEVKRKAEMDGYLIGIDGRRIAVGSTHSALNRLLQSAGAITMKYAMVLADRMIRKEVLDANGLIRYHDEEQWECKPGDVHNVGRLGVQSIVLAGKYLKLNVPLAGEYKIGDNWCDTH